MTPPTLHARHVPPAISPRLVSALAVFFAALTTLRGLGWALGNPDLGIPFVVATALVSPRTWGLLFTGIGLSLIGAYASGRHLPVWAAHALAAATYFGLAIPLTLAALHYDTGFQHLASPLGGLAWHALLAWLTGPVPRQDGGPRAADPRR